MRKLMTTFSSFSLFLSLSFSLSIPFICEPFVACPRKRVAVLNLSTNLLDQEMISI